MAGLSLRDRLGLKKAAQVKNLVFRRDYYRRTAMEVEASTLPLVKKQAAIRKLQKQIADVEEKISNLTARAKHPGFSGVEYAPRPADDPYNLPGLAHLALAEEVEETAEVTVVDSDTPATGIPEETKAAFKRTAIVGGSIIAALALLR